MKKNHFWLNLKSYTENVALIDASTGVVKNYSQLEDDVSCISDLLKLKKKCLIFLYTTNSYECIVTYLAALRSNNSILLLDEKLNQDIRNNLNFTYKPQLIITSNKEQSNLYDKQILLGNVFLYKRKNYSNDLIHPNLAVLLSTSGTTGSPKLVRLSYDNIQANAKSIAEYLPIDEKERPITSLSMSYSYGLSVINSHLLKGSSIVLTDKSIVFKDFWQIFNQYFCTSFAGVPYTYQILKRTGFDTMDLPTLKYMTQAGGRLSEEFIKYFLEYAEKNSKKFFVMYGQTEATARISYVPFEKLKNKIGSIGISIPDGNINLYNHSREIKQSDVVGEIVYSGPNVMMGYAEKRLDLQKDDELNGELRTGDLAYKDQDGYYFIIGRMKRFIKIFGLRINLDEVEKMLQNNFHIPVACIGKDDILKIVILNSDKEYTKQIKNKILEFYRLSHGSFTISLIEKIPANSSGKYDYSRIQEILDKV